jgi:hypothetical protein
LAAGFWSVGSFGKRHRQKQYEGRGDEPRPLCCAEIEGYSVPRSATLEVRAVVDAARQRMRFREEVWKFLEKKTRQGPAEILRIEVEVIGISLGLTEEEACHEFLGLRGSLWDLRSGDLAASTIPSAKGEEPPRNWFAFTDAYLL